MPNNFIMTNNTSDNRWDLTYSVDTSGTKAAVVNANGTFVDRPIKIAITTPAGGATVAGGGLTTTANYTGTPTISVGIDSQSTSGITITDTAQTSGYYVKLTSSSSALSGTTTAKRAAITLARTAGYVTAQAATTVSGLGETTTSPTVTVNSGSKTRYLVLPAATFASSGGSVYTSTGGWVPTGSAQNPIVDIGNGALSITGGGLTASTGYGSLTNNGYYNGSSYDTTDIIDITSQTSQANGYYKLTASGYGKVTRAAINKQITTAGYFAADSSAVQQIASATGTSNTGTTVYYVKKSTLSSSSLNSSSSTQTVTIGKGYYPTDRTVTINGMSTATVTPAINNTNLSTYFNTGSSSNYSITLQPTFTSTAGYIAEHTGTAGNGAVSYYAIKTTTRTAGAGSVTLTAGAGNVTLTVGTGDSGSSSATSMSMTTTTPSSGVYYTLTAKGKGTVTGTGKGTVSTGTGWVTSGSTTSNDSASASQTSNEATTYGYIIKSVYGDAISGSQPSSLTRTSGTYVDVEIQPYGYIKMPAGYYPLDRYVFANKANASNEATAASNYSLNVSSISGSNDVSVGTLADGKYPIVASNVSVTATLSAGTAGWFSSGSATDSDTDNVTVGKMQAATITASSSNATATTTVAPGNVTINSDSTSVTGKIILNLSPTTLTTGIDKYYIAIKANAAANSTGTTSSISGTANASVTTPGYAPSTLIGSGSVTGTATAKTSSKDSSVYYIPVPTVAGNFDYAPSPGSATASITNLNNVNYINDLSGKTAGVDYWGIKATATTTNGSYIPKYEVTTPGYLGGTLIGTSQPLTVTADTTGQTLYIPKATFSTNGGSITVATGGYVTENTTVGSISAVTPQFDGGALNNKGASVAGTNVTLSDTDTSGISIQAKGTAGRDAVLYNGAVNGYVNIADNITASGAVAATTWNGTNYYLTGVELTAGKTFSITVPNGNSTDKITFVFTVDSNYNVTVDGG